VPQRAVGVPELQRIQTLHKMHADIIQYKSVDA
jgi:hypothetical protein